MSKKAFFRHYFDIFQPVNFVAKELGLEIKQLRWILSVRSNHVRSTAFKKFKYCHFKKLLESFKLKISGLVYFTPLKKEERKKIFICFELKIPYDCGKFPKWLARSTCLHYFLFRLHWWVREKWIFIFFYFIFYLERDLYRNRWPILFWHTNNSRKDWREGLCFKKVLNNEVSDTD